jgi:hypothetical protein
VLPNFARRIAVPELDPELFWPCVDRSAGPGGCWPWTGATTDDGYGLVHADGQSARAHRVAWQLAGLPLRPGMTLDHVCRTRACCNPWHMTPVSRAEHARHGRARGRFDVLAPAPILDQHAHRVAAYLDQHGATEAAILAQRLEIPIRTLRQRHMAERLQARYGVRRKRRGGRVVLFTTSNVEVAC